MNSTQTSRQWLTETAQVPSEKSYELAEAYQLQLTKPPGSLGRLETIAKQFSAWQGVVHPQLTNINVVVFAGDHGVCAQNISAFPQVVTGQMLSNFSAGGAAICVLANQAKANFTAVNLGTVEPSPTMPHVVDCTVAPGTQDFTVQEAMTEHQCWDALNVGRRFAVEVCSEGGNHLNIGGEMGIGNTTSAAAIFSALLAVDAQTTVGPGTGIDSEGLSRKVNTVQKALQLHKSQCVTPMGVLQCVGGLEIAALVGFYIGSALNKTPALVDGYICTAAALLAVRINPSVAPWLMYSHRSAEPAHCLALDALDATPLLDFQMRLGEGSGAALCVPLLKSALALHNTMATFASAGVSDQ